ncbi:MAG TPA: ATP-dependent RNA helicase DbpA [Polyangiales bacterium]|nr:ATP-dependent RNA helicase DbpA [Polyangiales bacterium]
MSRPTDFASLALSPALIENVVGLGYTEMTPIQAAALPAILEGRDLIAQAKTGSGKTAAFGLGLLNSLKVAELQLHALVICPTRELADQVGREIRSLARSTPNVKLLTLCGGVPIRGHRESLEHGAHIVVGTPGRLRALADKAWLVLDTLAVLVLDEADRMLEMGFEDDLRALLQKAPEQRQTLLFSATYPEAIEQISQGYQRAPVRVTVDEAVGSEQLEQLFFEVGIRAEDRMRAVHALLAKYRPESTLIFCNTKEECDTLARALRRAGARTLALHGDLEQRERDEVLVVFANRSCSVLVATDVAARGLDIAGLDCVINYELSTDASVHVHRVGRTGRAGKRGLALSLFRPDDSYRLQRIEPGLPRPLQRKTLPALTADDSKLAEPSMATLVIEGGRRDKLRAGDVLGALTAGGAIAGDQVGKIQVQETRTYVAVKRGLEQHALDALANGRIKKRRFRVSKVAAG